MVGICKLHQILRSAKVEEPNSKDPSDNCKNHLDDVIINPTLVSSKVREGNQIMDQKNEPVEDPISSKDEAS